MNVGYDPAEHRAACKRHAMRRLWQRHGIAIGDAEYERLCDEARAAPSADRYGRFRPVTIAGKATHAVWSDELGCIVTFVANPKQIRGASPAACPPRRTERRREAAP